MKSARLALTGMVVCLAGVLSCGKVAELGSKLKAPEDDGSYERELRLAEMAELTVIPPPPEPGAPLVNVDAEVSILGYHDFSATRATNDMVIRPEKFRQQMELLKSSGVPVIAMSEYLAWKRGERSVPSPSVVITIDDGWKGVYQDAFPVLKEYGYPFSIYLYTNYLGGAGRSMSEAEVKEMMECGGEVGVHSVSHADMTQRKGRSEAAYEAWLREELGEALRILREKFGEEGVLPVFAYPYGKYNAKVMELAREFGYELGVTVWGKKATHETPDMEVGRYIVHGNDDRNFRYAMSFRGAGAVGSGALAAATAGGGPVSMWPKENEVIPTRTPEIVVDVSALGPIERESITLDLSGFGRVPVEYDAAAGIITHQVVEPLRNESCRVWLKLRRRGQKEMDALSWAFQIDRAALYLRSGEEGVGVYSGVGSPGEAAGGG